MQPLLLRSYTATSCIGAGLDAMLSSLRAGRSGLTPCDFETVDLDTSIGKVADVDLQTLRPDLAAYDCRNNRLAQLGLAQDGFVSAVQDAVSRFGRQRVAVLLGTSTSGILSTEQAFRQRDPATGKLPDAFDYARTHNSYSVADFVRHYFGLAGPAFVVSSACSSSAKVFGSAARLIETGMIDAAIVGGVDSLCLTTLYGFNSLELLSSRPCRPYDGARDGISIGEAAAFILLERKPAELPKNAVLLRGVGESSDAHHMSSPHPEGLGARLAMQEALRQAGLQAQDISYINLHGTATPSNDAAEDKAVVALFGDRTPCSSTKGATGHTLGAAGGIEAIIGALCLVHDFMPGGVNTESRDPALGCNYLLQNKEGRLANVISNSFGFGGTNCSLILSRTE